jgi:hypothetical protein
MPENLLTPAEIEEYAAQAEAENWPMRDIVAMDVFANVLTGGRPDETLSTRFQELADRGNKFGKFMVWWLDKIQAHHGRQAEAGDLGRDRAAAGDLDRQLEGEK